MIDPQKFRPLGNNVLVLDDKRKEVTSGGIIVPVETGAEKVTEGSGTVIRISNNEKLKSLGLEPGARVVYRSYLKYAHPLDAQEFWEDGSEKKYFLMSAMDLMAVMQPGVVVGVLSGRPMVPAKEG